MTDNGIPDALLDEPATVKLIYRELQTAGDPLTYSELVERTGLARRTVRRAISRLEDAELAEQRWMGAQTQAYALGSDHAAASDGGMGGGQIDRQNGG